METPNFEKETFNWRSEAESLDLGNVDVGELVDFLLCIGLTQKQSLTSALTKAKETLAKGLDEVDDNTNEMIANMSSELEDFVMGFEADATV